MRKNIRFICIFLMLVLLLVGCGSSKEKSKFDAEEVKKAGKNVVELINDENFEKLCNEVVAESYRSSLTPELIKERIKQGMSFAGKFIAFSGEAVMFNKDQNGNETAVSCILATYENKQVEFAISLNKKMEMTGINIK